MYSLYIKFQEKIFTGKKIIQLWNFGNFGIPEIIPKILVTLRFSKISLHELKGYCKCFKMRYWPHFYVDPTHSNTYFSKVGIWRVLLQGTVQCLAYKLAICQVYKIRCCSGLAQYKIFINGSFETTFSQFSSNNSKFSKISRLINF